jgi:hypothetical protein
MLNIGFISLDILIIVAIFLVLIFHGIKTSKRLLLTLIIAMYPALIIFQNFPYVNFEAGMPTAIAFVVIYIVIVLLLKKTISKKKVYTTLRKFVDYPLLALAYISLVISVSTHQIPALQNLYTFSGFLPNLINQIDYGVILILPLIIILATAKSDKI